MDLNAGGPLDSVLRARQIRGMPERADTNDGRDWIPAGDRLPLAGIVLVALVTGLWFAVQPGFLYDDLQIAAQARELSWFDVLVTRPGTFPFHLHTWKLAVLLSPEEPYLPVRFLNVILHGAAVVLVYLLLRKRCRGPLLFGLVAAFAVMRPRNEFMFWACAHCHIIMAAFAFGAMLAWERFLAAGRRRDGTLAVILGALTTLWMTTGIVLPALMGVWALLEAPRGERAAALRRALPYLVVLGAAELLLMANAWLRYIPGIERINTREEMLGSARIVPVMGLACLRLYVPVYWDRYLGLWTAGGGALLAAALLFWKGNRTVRLGLCWSFALLAVPVAARGITEFRYEYAALPGALLVVAGLTEMAAERAAGFRRIAAAGIWLWALAHAAFIPYDLRLIAGCQRMSAEARELVRGHRDEIAAAGRLVIANRPRNVEPRDAVLYEVEGRVEVTLGRACEPGVPCLDYRVRGAAAPECAADGEFPLAAWRPAAP